jgi:hypothetical protein
MAKVFQRRVEAQRLQPYDENPNLQRLSVNALSVVTCHSWYMPQWSAPFA